MTADRPRVAGVRFNNAGKIFYFDTAGLRLEAGEYVVVETVRGPEVGRVVIAPGQVLVNELRLEDLKPILRLATDGDIRRADSLARRAAELLPEARRLAADAGFRGRIEHASFTLDGRRLTFSFASEERLDYREFLRRASKAFSARIDMRQVGARDRARLAGGYGICGRELCCASWLETFPAISIRMAKEQELPLNPQKISGLCGRLLCCLSYEEEGYRTMRESLPRVGQRCSTPSGEGRVLAVNILRRQVTLLVEGQRVEVGDRDLGTVVRWDPSSRSAAPPPSLPRVPAGGEPGDEEEEAFEEPAAPLPGRIRQRRPPAAREAPPPAEQPSRTQPPARERRRDAPPRSSLADAASRTFRRSSQPPNPQPERPPARGARRSPPPGPPPEEQRGAPRGRRRARGPRPGDAPESDAD
jgi:cell fate regulator YaaT (PSP1 superfamily)